MGVPGRKSWTEELKIKERYSALSEPFFQVLKEHLDSDEKKDRQWAAERIEKAYIKMIPQDVTSGGKELPTPIMQLNALRGNFSDQENSGTE